MLPEPIYLDYAASTPVDPRVAAVMLEVLQDPLAFANPSSVQHAFGQAALARIERAREQAAAALQVKASELIWLSGATEANNLAILGFALANQTKGKHIISVKTEHKAVLDAVSALAKQGFSVSLLSVDANGLMDIHELRQALRKDTILVSVMAVNNETGVVQDIAAIAEVVHQHGARLHVDGVQALGKMPLHFLKAVDLASFSAHKIYGPKGVGFLYKKHDPRLRVQALLHGGNQEHGLRAGTLATHQIVGCALAVELAVQELPQRLRAVQMLRQHLERLLANIPELILHSQGAASVPHILNCAVPQASSQALARYYSQVAVSNGSACNVNTRQASHVLLAQGIPLNVAQNSLRFSLSHHTTMAELTQAVEGLRLFQ